METRLTINKLKEVLWPMATVTCVSCHRAGLRSRLTRVPHHSVVMTPHEPADKTVHEEWYCTTCLDQLVRGWNAMVDDADGAIRIGVDMAVDGDECHMEMEMLEDGNVNVRWDRE